jgi:alpha 1,6-mannosyltransferase
LRVKYGVRWTDLRRLARPVRIGEVVVLPVTGFSPGVGNFGAMSRKREPNVLSLVNIDDNCVC